MLLTKLTTTVHGDAPEAIPLFTGRASSKNQYTVLIGPNATRKSLTLRRIVDCLFRIKPEQAANPMIRQRLNATSLTLYGKQDQIKLEWKASKKRRQNFFSTLIAISGVATDKFPSKSGTGLVPRKTKYDEDFYFYIGPRTGTNIVSRGQSINQLASVIFRNWERIPARWGQLSHIFDFARLSRGLNFVLGPVTPSLRHAKKGVDEISLLRGEILNRLQISGHASEDKESKLRPHLLKLLNDYKVLLACEAILADIGDRQTSKSDEITVAIDFDEVDSYHIPYSPKALYLLLEARMIRVRQTTALTADDQQDSLELFSSGQWQVLCSLLSLCMAVESNSIILFDEPENSLHPEWAREYFSCVDEVLKSVTDCHVIVATHSPLIASTVPVERAQIVRLMREKYSNHISADVVAGSSYGWTSEDVLIQVFGLSSSRGLEFERLVDEGLALIGKGEFKSTRLHQIARELGPMRENLPPTDAGRFVLDSIIKLAAVDSGKVRKNRGAK